MLKEDENAPRQEFVDSTTEGKGYPKSSKTDGVFDLGDLWYVDQDYQGERLIQSRGEFSILGRLYLRTKRTMAAAITSKDTQLQQISKPRPLFPRGIYELESVDGVIDVVHALKNGLPNPPCFDRSHNHLIQEYVVVLILV